MYGVNPKPVLSNSHFPTGHPSNMNNPNRKSSRKRNQPTLSPHLSTEGSSKRSIMGRVKDLFGGSKSAPSSRSSSPLPQTPSANQEGESTTLGKSSVASLTMSRIEPYNTLLTSHSVANTAQLTSPVAPNPQTSGSTTAPGN